MDKEKIKKAVLDLLEAIGEDPLREGLKETPQRVADMYEEIFYGISKDPKALVKVFSEPGCDELVLIKDIPLYSMCEHHMLPFIGVAHIAYIPRDGQVLGLSKFARIVDMISRRLQLQERLTMEIADTIMESANPLGALVVVEAEHLCMTMRGIKKPGAKTVTSALRGTLKSDARTRAEAFSLIRSEGR